MSLAWILVGAAVLTVAALALLTYGIARAVEKAVPPRGRFVTIDGSRIHYLDRGRGPAIVLVHGLGGQMANFSHSLLDRLTDEFRVILVDRPGSGYSTRPPGASARLRAQGDVLARFMEVLDLDRPLLVGHSLGGAVALAVALDHPDHISGLALIAPLTHPQETVPPLFKGLAIRSDHVRRAAAWTVATPASILAGHKALAFVFAPDAPPRDFAVAGGGLVGLRPHAFYATSCDMLAVNLDLPGMAERYRALAVPVAILYGRDDRVLDWRHHGQAMADKVAGLDLAVVPGGHMLPVTAPDETAAWIKAVARRMAAPR